MIVRLRQLFSEYLVEQASNNNNNNNNNTNNNNNNDNNNNNNKCDRFIYICYRLLENY